MLARPISLRRQLLAGRTAAVVRLALLVAYIAFVAAIWERNGVPLERLQVLGWVAGGLFIATTGLPDGGPVRIVRDWLPIWFILAAYDLSRGVADTLGMPVQMGSVVRAEKFISFGHVPTVLAQQHLGPYDGPVRWWEVPVSFAYLSHFVVPFAIMGVLWARNRAAFRHYRNALLLLTALGLLTYLLLPAAPPWMASREGLIGPVQRVGLRGMEAFGLDTADALVRYGPRFGNPVAALPSLHAGWSTLTALWFARRMRRRWWPLLLAYPALMGFSLVVSGEHYVVDVLLGYLYAAVALWAVVRLERHWAASRVARRLARLELPGRATRQSRPEPVTVGASAATATANDGAEATGTATDRAAAGR